MDCCIVCLQSNCPPYSRISIHSSVWNSKQIQRVIEKHLWWWYLKPQSESHPARWICTHCWEEISSFHSFYLRVEMAHKQHETLMGITNLWEVGTCSNPTSKDISKGKLFNTNSTVVPKVESIEQDKGTNLESNKKVYQKQTIQVENSDQNGMENEIALDTYIKTEFFNAEYQIAENNIQVLKVKKEPEDNHSLNNDDVNKNVNQKQPIQAENSDQNDVENKINLNTCIKTEVFKDEYQIVENNIQVLKVKKEPEDNHSLNNDDVNNKHDLDNLEQNFTEINHIDNSADKTANNIDVDSESTEIPESHSIYVRPKKHDIIDFYDEFKFKLKCNICNSSKSTFADLCSHYKDRHNMRGFAMCCGQKFARRYLLIDHLCVHKDPNFFKCHKCHRVFRAREYLSAHLRKNICTNSTSDVNSI